VPQIVSIKGTVSRYFRPSVFSLNCNPGSPHSWAKTVLHIDSNSQRYSIKFDEKNQLCAMPHSAESIFLDNDKLKILFYCHGVGKITYDRFVWKTVTLKASVKVERILFRIPAVRKKLRAMRHSAESIFVVEFNRISQRIQICMQNRFSPWIRGPRGTI
jgi:hypothetical protein